MHTSLDRHHPLLMGELPARRPRVIRSPEIRGPPHAAKVRTDGAKTACPSCSVGVFGSRQTASGAERARGHIRSTGHPTEDQRALFQPVLSQRRQDRPHALIHDRCHRGDAVPRVAGRTLHVGESPQVLLGYLVRSVDRVVGHLQKERLLMMAIDERRRFPAEGLREVFLLVNRVVVPQDGVRCQ